MTINVDLKENGVKQLHGVTSENPVDIAERFIFKY